MTTEERSGVIFAFISTVGYALFPIFTKLVYQNSTLQPPDVILWRFVFALPLMWLGVAAWERVTGARPARPLPRARLMLVGGLIALAAITAITGFSLVDVGVFVVIFHSYPVMVALAQRMMGRPVSGRMWAALVLTSVGVVLTAPSLLDFVRGGASTTEVVGVLVALLNAALVAAYLVLNESVLRGHGGSARATAYSISGAAVVAVSYSLLLRAEPAGSLPIWGLLLAIAFVGTVVPLFALMMATQRIGAARTSILGSVEPIWTILLALWLLNERLLPIQWVGTLLIIASVVVLEGRASWWRGWRRPVAVPR